MMMMMFVYRSTVAPSTILCMLCRASLPVELVRNRCTLPANTLSRVGVDFSTSTIPTLLYSAAGKLPIVGRMEDERDGMRWVVNSRLIHIDTCM